MAKQVMIDKLTGEVSTPTPTPKAADEAVEGGEGFTLGQGEVGKTELEDGGPGLFAFLLLAGVLLFFIGSVVYGRKKDETK